MDGILIINKPKGYTSHDIVNVLRKKLNTKKIGHAGTLDPNATGVLIALVGKATKLSKYLIEHDKVYIAKLKLGEEKDTGDADGETICMEDVEEISTPNIEETLKSFLGKQQQKPPKYSAIKINGKKAYEYARQGQDVEIKPREIEIYDIDLLNYSGNIITFKVKCSKGTYIRTLCEDIAKRLNTVGYTLELNRIKVDKFDIKDSIEIENLDNIEKIKEKLYPIEEILEEYQKIYLNQKYLKLFLNGVKLKKEEQDGVYTIYYNNNLIATGVIEKGILKRDICFQEI